MQITPEMFNLATMYLNSTSRSIKKIKVTSEFADYLDQTCHPIYWDKDLSNSEGIRAVFTGIPVVVDDEIENKYFELEY